ncbi:endonuclease/exonuclease/phosphatase family protein [Isoptericola aurantiacus]|uniref:endonuclease/exonuclease/phosphatase family protein n=1 Tax=Isoptericola aurantiacus TaxID=3377839 RepID=UPI00383B4D15
MRPASEDRSLLLLLALVSALTAELVRASGPLLDRAFSEGVAIAAVTALVTYAAPALVVAALSAGRRLTGRVVLVAVALLVAARLALQVLGVRIAAVPLAPELGAVRYYGGLSTVALAIGVLVLVAAFAAGVGRPRAAGGAPDDGRPAADGVRPAADDAVPSRVTDEAAPPRAAVDGAPLTHGLLVARGVTFGLLGSAALGLLLGTWDAFWRPGPTGWVPPALLGAGAVWFAWRLRALPSAPSARGLWVLGPFLALGVQVFANPALVASTTGLPPVLAACGLVVAALATGVSLSLLRPLGRPLTGGIAFVAGIWLLFLTVPRPQDPPLAWALVLLITASLLPAVGARSLAGTLTRPARPLSGARLAAAAAVVGLTTALPLLVYQLDFDVPLPFPGGLVPVAAAVLVALPAAVGARRLVPSVTAGGPLLTGSVAGLAGVAVVLGVLAPVHAGSEGPDDELSVMTWNVHYGVSSDPSVRLDTLATVIRESDPEVVALQEVSRGWILGGGADMLTYLARTTGREVAWSPAADRQFGNALLWDPDRVEVTDVQRIELPFGEGPQDRSALAATVRSPAGQVRLVTTHLQHREQNHSTRLEQLEAIFDAEPVDGPYVLLGDLNAEPGWEEITAVTDQGLVSGQDDVGDPAALTSPAVTPRYRVDWVFATPATPFTSFEILDVVASDHRPLLATVRLDAG